MCRGARRFSNRWYPAAIETVQTRHFTGHAVRVVTPPPFIATKLEAFHGRGGNDVVTSHDLEDIIAVVDVGQWSWLNKLLSSPTNDPGLAGVAAVVPKLGRLARQLGPGRPRVRVKVQGVHAPEGH